MKIFVLCLYFSAANAVNLPGSGLPSGYEGVAAASVDGDLNKLPGSDSVPIADTEVEEFEDFPPESNDPTVTIANAPVDTPATATLGGTASQPTATSTGTSAPVPPGAETPTTTQQSTPGSTSVAVTISNYPAQNSAAPGSTPLCHVVSRRYLARRAVSPISAIN